MRIVCVGGGPAGLYFGILASRLGAGHQITVYERSPEGQTYGWGVVFWDDLLRQLEQRDAPTAREIRSNAFLWKDQVIDVRGRAPARVAGRGYSMARTTLLEILGRRARELGVELRYGQEVRDIDELGHADLIVASDGVNSALRARHEKTFGTAVRQGCNMYIWLGTNRVFRSFTFPFVPTEAGWIWAHAYGFEERASTFIVETRPETWAGLGFDRMRPAETMRTLERLFAPQLDGHTLRPQPGVRESASWLQFRTVTNECWHHGSLVLMGDAAHTTHFTVGSGTRLAIEDAIGLVDTLDRHDRVESALEGYGRHRATALRQIQREAVNSARWFEDVPRYIEDDGRFGDMLVARRSSILPHMRPQTYLRLAGVASSLPFIARPARKAVARLSSACASRRR